MRKKISMTALILSLVFLSGPLLAGELITNVSASGTATGDYLFYGNGTSSHTIITNTLWVSDRITVAAGPGAVSVLDQHLDASPVGTNISRYASYIGPGNIETISQYKGSNLEYGEDSVTGISIAGGNYGTLIQNGSLEFNADFGGMRESVAVGGVGYSIVQFGFVDTDGSGDYTPADSAWSSVRMSGDDIGTISTLNYGSTPQHGPDLLQVSSTSWASGTGNYYLDAVTPDISTSVEFNYQWGNIDASIDFDTLVGEVRFSAD